MPINFLEKAMRYVIGILIILWVLIFYAQAGVPEDTIAAKSLISRSQQPELANIGLTSLNVKEPWSKSYDDLKDIIVSIDEDTKNQTIPQFTIVRGNNIVATLQLDAFGIKVLKEAEAILKAYRVGLGVCIHKSHNEFKTKMTHSFEKYAWFLDSYVRLMVRALQKQEKFAFQDGVLEKSVTNDRTLYAYTRLALAYIMEKQERDKRMQFKISPADIMLEGALTDIANRVFRLNLTLPFDRKELIRSGPTSQPIFQTMASEENKLDLDMGMDPLSQMMSIGNKEPRCRIKLSSK